MQHARLNEMVTRRTRDKAVHSVRSIGSAFGRLEGGNRPQRLLQSWLLIAVVVMAAIVAGAPSSADVIKHDGPGFLWIEYQHMPDLDQVRTGLSKGFPGNPNSRPGDMHCAPTAAVNMATYWWHHGQSDKFPPGQFTAPQGFEPDHDNWTQWGPGSAPHFAAATANIANMGNLMLTNQLGPGTPAHGITAGLKKFFGGNFVVESRFPGLWGPNTFWAGPQLAEYTVEICYMRYQQCGWFFDVPILVPLRSGHCVTVNELINVKAPGCPGPTYTCSTISVSDPADPPWNLNQQSPFKDRDFWVWNGWVLIANQFCQPFQLRFASTLWPSEGVQWLLMDWVYGVKPKGAKARRQVPGVAAENVWEIVVLSPHLGEDQAERVFASPSGTPILDFVNHPDGVSTLVLTEGEDGEPAVVWLVSPFSVDPIAIHSVEGATQLLVGRLQTLYVLAGETLHQFNIGVPDVDDPDLPEELALGLLGKKGPDTVELPVAAQAIAYDVEADEIVLLSATTGSIIRVPADFGEEPTTRALPREMPQSDSGTLALHGDTMWASLQGVEGVFGIILDEGEDELVVDQLIEMAEIGSPDSVDVDDGGNLWVVSGGAVLELTLDNKDEWTIVEDSQFAPFDVGDRFRIDRSRSNFVEELHFDPEYTNILPEDVPHGMLVPLCFADLNNDGVVDGADLLLLLGAWGNVDLFNPTLADLNKDFVVNGQDLMLLLQAWGPCD